MDYDPDGAQVHDQGNEQEMNKDTEAKQGKGNNNMFVQTDLVGRNALPDSLLDATPEVQEDYITT